MKRYWVLILACTIITFANSVAGGDLLPNEASTLSSILEARRKALETEELELRIAALEALQ